MVGEPLPVEGALDGCDGTVAGEAMLAAREARGASGRWNETRRRGTAQDVKCECRRGAPAQGRSCAKNPSSGRREGDGGELQTSWSTLRSRMMEQRDVGPDKRSKLEAKRIGLHWIGLAQNWHKTSVAGLKRGGTCSTVKKLRGR